MTKKEQGQLAAKVGAAMARCEETIQTLNSDHPQVVEVRLEHEGRYRAFEAVLEALRGNHTLLNIYAD